MPRKRIEHTAAWLSEAQSALAALDTAGVRAVRPHLETLVSKKAAEPATWRRLGRLVEDALAACDKGDLERTRALLEAIRAVAWCAEEA